MKYKILLVTLVVVLSGCGKDDIAEEETSNNPPSSFSVQVEDITDTSATLTWESPEDPENDPITYSIYLIDEEVKSHATNFSFALSNLDSSTEYTGKVIASDGRATTESVFTFTTKLSTTVYTGNVQLKSQEEVNEFGSGKYGKIEGDLVLGIEFATESDIADLTPLFELSEISGSLEIRSILSPSLAGLENLKRIGLDLVVGDNTELTALGSPGQFEAIGRNVMIWSNAKLTSLQGLEKIAELETFYLGTNSSLQSLEGLNNLKKLRGSLSIINNHALVDISSLQSIEEISGSLLIQNNSVLPSLEGLHNLRFIGGGISMYGLHQLIDVSGLRNIEEVGLEILIHNNNNLVSIDGFQKVSVVNGNLIIYGCPKLTSIEGLQNIGAINGDLQFFLNSAITDIDGFIGLKSISNGFYLYQNEMLTNLDGFANLETVTAHFQITSNPNLGDLCGITTAVLNYPEFAYIPPQGNAYDPSRQDFIDGNCSL